MHRHLMILATLFIALAAFAQDPIPSRGVRIDENFDHRASIAATRLIPLGGNGQLSLVNTTNGGKRLRLKGNTGFALPTGRGTRFALSFDLERGANGGRFLLGDDRDSQHGFSRTLAVGPNGLLSIAGHGTKTKLRVGTIYHVQLIWHWVSPTSFVLEQVAITGRGLTFQRSPSKTLRGAIGRPIPFRHEGSSSAFLDNLVLRTLR